MSEVYIIPSSVADTLKTVPLDGKTVGEYSLRVLSLVLSSDDSVMGFLIYDGFDYKKDPFGVSETGRDQKTTYRFLESFRDALATFEEGPKNI